MKKYLIITCISLICLGCQAKKIYTGLPEGDAAGKTVTEADFLALPDAMIAGMADKTDFIGSTTSDPLDTVDDVIAALSPVGAILPLGGVVLGIAGTVTRLSRKYRPIIEEGKADAQTLYELVRGIKTAGNGNGVSSVTGESLATNLRSSMSDASKVRVGQILGRLEHQKVDES